MDRATANSQTLPPKRRKVVVGCSAGGFQALSEMLVTLPADYPAPILVVQHLHASDGGAFALHLGQRIALEVCEPCDKQEILPSRVYVAPANYHLLVERGDRVALSTEGRVNWSRPSIDVLFESATRAWGAQVVAIVLSGANDDGARGVRMVKRAGGIAAAQDPMEAEYGVMPQAAIDTGAVDLVLPAAELGRWLAGSPPKAETRAAAQTAPGDQSGKALT